MMRQDTRPHEPVGAVRAGLVPHSGSPTRGLFRKEGEYWTVGYAGHLCRLKEAQGSTGQFVGRTHELAVLHEALDQSFAGHGRTVLLAGEPGIGKTRLTTELAAFAHQQHAHVWVGRCHEGDGAPPFWLWTQILRSYLSSGDTDTIRAELGAGAADIAQVMPEVGVCLALQPTAAGLDAEQARFRFFDSLTTFFLTAARRQPLVLILDDLHWADTPSLLLLQFVAREIASAPVLIVGAYRELALDRAHPLAHALGELVRTPGSQSLQLPGLSETDVAQVLAHSRLTPSAALVTALHQRTEGNPFFLTAVVQLLEAEEQQSTGGGQDAGMAFPIPHSVQVAIGRRLHPLSADCQHLLQIAAVLGREFGVETLAVVGHQVGISVPEDQLLELLEEAVALRVLLEVPAAVGRYSFAHALIRETLYEDLSALRRMRLHQRIATMLAHRYGSPAEAAALPHASAALAELAYHFFQAAQGGQASDKAIAYARQAGVHAMSVFAYEEAVGHYERALQALARHGAHDARQRCELLLALGEAQTGAGTRPLARETFHQAAALARTLYARGEREHSAQLLARAALGVSEWAFIMAEPSVLALLEETLALLGEEESLVRAQLLSRLASALYYVPQEGERRRTLSRQAVDMARRLGDTATLCKVLISHCWVLWTPEYLPERLATSREMVRLAEATGAHEIALSGWLWLATDVIEHGDIAEAERILSVIDQLNATVRQPLWQWWTPVYRAALAFLWGHFAEAERQIRQAWALGQRVKPAFAAQYFWGFLVPILHEQQRLAEVETDLQAFLTQFAYLPGWRVAPVWLASQAGQEAAARQGFAKLAAQDFTDLPKDGHWHGNMAALCEICLALDETPHAATLYTLWRPYAGRNCVAGASIATLRGAVARYLGALAAVLSRWDEAEQHFHDALAMNTRMGARPWVAYTQYDYATMLLRRHQPGDHDKAQALLALALATAQEVGMPRLVGKIHTQKADERDEDFRRKAVGTAPSSPLSLPPPAASLPQPQDPNVLRRDGDSWILVYEGHACHLKDAKGVHYLAALLHDPGREFHVLDLLLLTDPPPATTAAEAHLSPARRTLREANASAQADAPARAAYKSRLHELQAELDEADRRHDLGRLGALQAEQTFLTEELTVAYGFRRQASDSHEQVRKNVTNRIRAILQRLRTTHPSAWQHLRRFVKTGAFCSYTPEHPLTWEG